MLDAIEGQTVLKVMSFNMKRNLFSFGRHAWSKRAALVAEAVRSISPDIIGTQELTAVPLSDLQRLLPGYAVIGQGRGGGTKGEYTAIFYHREKFTLLSQETFWLSPTPHMPSRGWFAAFPRICTWCEFSIQEAPEKKLRVYNTHLDHVSYFARIGGLRLILNRILERYQSAPGPVVFMGDFNATPTSRTLRKWGEESLRFHREPFLRDSYHVLLKEPGRSYHGFMGRGGGKPIDYIFTNGDIILRSVDLWRTGGHGCYPSDHYPVVAEIEV